MNFIILLKDKLAGTNYQGTMDQPFTDMEQYIQLLSTGPDSILIIASFKFHIFELDLSKSLSLESAAAPDSANKANNRNAVLKQRQ